ncbi:hypothetical protein OE88DRAFT_1728775 [Heliocybe sulcata]|uniref:Uncharacterized protein n=1 Tax=Heliocybe sulcata TaxID=5364 RepID=A0A5C3MT80_9AGAM|nr:hypothetical protein OE88DRAFT_1728775 [Heliocybe sulcata]
MAMTAYDMKHIPAIGVSATPIPAPDVNAGLTHQWNSPFSSDINYATPRKVCFRTRQGRGVLFHDAADMQRATSALEGPGDIAFNPKDGPTVTIRIRWPHLEHLAYQFTVCGRISKAELAFKVVKHINEFIQKNRHAPITNPAWSLNQRNIWPQQMRLLSLVLTNSGVFEVEAERLYPTSK